MAIIRTADVDSDGTPTTGTIRNNAWKQTIYNQIDALVADASLFFPAWTSTGTAPDIGDGTITGRFHKHNQLCLATIKVTFGAGTTFGSGDYRFSVPFDAADVELFGIALATDTSPATNYYGLTAIVSTTTLAVLVHGSAAQWGRLVPFTWAAGDSIIIKVAYEVA